MTAISPSPQTLEQPGPPVRAAPEPTLWGLNLQSLHDRYWASRGIQVVRMGQPSAIVPHAELFLLTDARTLVLFRPAPILDNLYWMQPDLVSVRLIDRRKFGYSERIEADGDGRFIRVSRVYEGTDPQLARVGLTTDPELATIWQSEESPRNAWRKFRRTLPPQLRYASRLEGRVFDSSRASEAALFTRELVRWWQRPDSTIDGIAPVADRVWTTDSPGFTPGPAVRGPLWVGAGRTLTADSVAVGPGVLWDDPAARPQIPPIKWQDIELRAVPAAPTERQARSALARKRPLKRAFDVPLALFALLITLPLYPIVILLILIEDGFPIFFSHERETIGGRSFGCIKFRSMRKDAEKLKQELAAKNQADGPQFFIADDPRLTRVGKIIRDLQIDELPQFFNVLAGDMSVVGPRPSPFKENQYCPPWREARLSVRPGITGLWQISRTRATGADFQEWIKYDIEYVEKQSFLLDLWIIWKTILLVIRKATMAS